MIHGAREHVAAHHKMAPEIHDCATGWAFLTTLLTTLSNPEHSRRRQGKPMGSRGGRMQWDTLLGAPIATTIVPWGRIANGPIDAPASRLALRRSKGRA
ncbi:MAG: hypothetical protein JF591_09475 [Lysobacter sp.]|nr:hypothetical protein [Lysobacter sp.]